MKDLITSIGAIMILMVFVMQFCMNQVIASRILLADAVIKEMENVETISISKMEEFKDQLSRCFDCASSEVIMKKNDSKFMVQIPIKKVVACGEFLGISEEENRSTYIREIVLE